MDFFRVKPAPQNQPPVYKGGAAFGGIDVLPGTHPNLADFEARSRDPNPWPEVTGNTAGFYLPADEGFLRLPELVVSMPNELAAGVPQAGQMNPGVRKFLFPPLPPGSS